ncbi:glycine zipper 2TM domain-containing protein [Cupriavidus sp. YAF13]|uniref:glycine zipper 2TM domain-containing protein n=1 Tax=Cupriavidus sp. YAF13 TaxID=3233075 RepID=UPI003F8E162F
MPFPSFPLRTAALALLAAGALAGCVSAPYGGGYGGYGAYGNSGTYGSSTQAGGAYPVAYPQQGYQQPAYPQADYPQSGYPQAPVQESYPQQGYPQAGYPQPSQPQAAYGNDAYGVRYGQVESIEMLPGQPASGGVAGTLIGGMVGGLLGHQVGGGRGNTVATIGGAVVGAVAGNEVEKRTNTAPPAYRIRVRTTDNGYLTVTQSTPYNLRNGDRVKVQNGVAMPY